MTDRLRGAAASAPAVLSRPLAASLLGHGAVACLCATFAAARAPEERPVLESVTQSVLVPLPVEVDESPPPPPAVPPPAGAAPRAEPDPRPTRVVARPAQPVAPTPPTPPTPAPQPAAPPPLVTAAGGSEPVAAAPEGPPAPAQPGPVAPAPAPPAPSTAEAGNGAGGTGPMVDVGQYLSTVQERVSRHRRYPEMAIEMGMEGVVEVRVLLNPDGSLASPPAVDESSGHDLLDQEALRIVARAAPFPPLTGHRAPVRLRVPVRFHLDG